LGKERISWPKIDARWHQRTWGAQGHTLTLKAAGEVTDDTLKALKDYIKRQRKRLQSAQFQT
jgi:hypothetical protein